jgi:hypothetical protein
MCEHGNLLERSTHSTHRLFIFQSLRFGALLFPRRLATRPVLTKLAPAPPAHTKEISKTFNTLNASTTTRSCEGAYGYHIRAFTHAIEFLRERYSSLSTKMHRIPNTRSFHLTASSTAARAVTASASSSASTTSADSVSIIRDTPTSNGCTIIASP